MILKNITYLLPISKKGTCFDSIYHESKIATAISKNTRVFFEVRINHSMLDLISHEIPRTETSYFVIDNIILTEITEKRAKRMLRLF